MRVALLTLAALSAGTARSHRSPLLQAPPAVLSKANPFEGSERAGRAGAKLYEQECAGCHGKRGQGFGKAPALNTPMISKAPAGALYWLLRNGSLRRGMPSFAHLPEQQRWEIITYLRQASATRVPQSPRPHMLQRHAAEQGFGISAIPK